MCPKSLAFCFLYYSFYIRHATAVWHLFLTWFLYDKQRWRRRRRAGWCFGACDSLLLLLQLLHKFIFSSKSMTTDRCTNIHTRVGVCVRVRKIPIDATGKGERGVNVHRGN